MPRQLNQNQIDVLLLLYKFRFATYNKLESIFGQRFDMFSKSELTGMEDMPEILPDALIRLKTSDSSRARERYFFLYFAEERQPLFAISNVITKQLEYGDSEDWNEVFGKPPAIILVCDTPALERRLHRQAGRIEDDAAKGQKFYTATSAGVISIGSTTDPFLMPLKRMPDGRIPLTAA